MFQNSEQQLKKHFVGSSSNVSFQQIHAMVWISLQNIDEKYAERCEKNPPRIFLISFSLNVWTELGSNMRLPRGTQYSVCTNKRHFQYNTQIFSNKERTEHIFQRNKLEKHGKS